MLEVLTFFSPRYGIQLTLVISILLGLVLIGDTALLLLRNESYIPFLNQLHLYTRILLAIFFALATIRNWQLLQSLRYREPAYQTDADDYDDRRPWER
jgi:hypothetical protein